jgi:hypothetical protein
VETARRASTGLLLAPGCPVGDALHAALASLDHGLGTTAQALGRGSSGLERLLDAGANDVPDIANLVAAKKAEINATIANLAVVTGLSYDHLRSVETPWIGCPCSWTLW